MRNKFIQFILNENKIETEIYKDEGLQLKDNEAFRMLKNSEEREKGRGGGGGGALV